MASAGMRCNNDSKGILFCFVNCGYEPPMLKQSDILSDTEVSGIIWSDINYNENWTLECLCHGITNVNPGIGPTRIILPIFSILLYLGSPLIAGQYCRGPID